MTLDNVLKLMADSAGVASHREGMPPAEKLALDIIRWAPRYVKENSRDYATGVVLGTFRMSMYAEAKINDAVSQALFVLEEVLKYDGIIPRQQVEEAAAKLALLGLAKVA